MAFPVVASFTSGATVVNDTTPTLTYPGSIAANDILITALAIDGNGVASSGWPAGWTLLSSTVSGTGCRVEWYWKRATGAETGSFDVTTASEMHSWWMGRITGGHTTTAPVAGTAAVGTSVNPNSPTLNPATWDVEDTLWIASFGEDSATAITVTTWPTSYASNQHYARGNNTGGAAIAVATRELAGASDDPAAWTLSGSEQWVAQTIAIRPAPAGPAGQTVSPAKLGGSVQSTPTVAPGGVGVSPALVGGSTLQTPAIRMSVAPPLIGPSVGVITPTPFQFILFFSPIVASGVVFTPAFGLRFDAPLVGGTFEGFDPAAFGGGGSLLFEPVVVRPIEIPVLGGGSLFSPVVARATEPQTVTAPLISRVGAFAEDAFDPAAYDAGGLRTPVISQSITAQPGVVGGYSLFSPTVMPSQAVLAGLITQAGVTFAPVVASSGVGVHPDLLGGYSLFAATVTAGAFSVTPNRIDQAAVVFGLTITTGALTVSPPLIDVSQPIVAPDVVVGSVIVIPGFLGPSGITFAPALTARVDPGLLGDPGVTFRPVLSGGLIVIAGTAPIAAATNLRPQGASTNLVPVGSATHSKPER